jgi:hypothetical protein
MDSELSQGRLRLADLVFDVSSATLDAFVDDERNAIAWGIGVRTRPSRVEQTDAWNPYAYCEILLYTSPGEVSSWIELGGRRFAWTADSCNDDARTCAMLEVYDAYPIYDSTLMFERAGTHLTLEWHAKADVRWRPDRYWEGLELQIASAVAFDGFFFGADDETTARTRLARFFDPSAYRFVQKDGVSLLVPG